MHGGRTPKNVSGRGFVSPHHAKRSPLFSLSRVTLPDHPHDRCLEGALVCRSTERRKFVWDRRWYDRSGNQCRPAGRLYFWLPLIATFGWRLSRSIFQIARLLSRLRMRELLQSPAHALGLAQLVLGRLRRSLCAALLDGHLARCASLLAAKRGNLSKMLQG